jgi:predicted DCC family thiol-disulfide oxidoreductase YuxK
MIVALYDGYCAICQTTLALITALDWFKRVTFVDLHTPGIETRYPQFTHEELMGQIHVIDEQGRVFAGFDGTRRLLKAVPLGFPIWLLLQLPGMDRVGIRVYRWIASHRYAINRMLRMPEPPAGKSDHDDCLENGVCKLPSLK